MADPRIISLDIETYGLFRRNWKGEELPAQTVFEPRHSLAVDGVKLSDLIPMASITIPKEDTRTGKHWDAEAISRLEPGETIVLLLHKPKHQKLLRKWLAYADTIIGANLLFDIRYLRMHPLYRAALERQAMLDVTYLNFLQCEVTPERSLKDIGPVLGKYAYAPEQFDREQAYDDPWSEKAQKYNAADTHNALLAVAEFARLIRKEFGTESDGNDKLSPYCVEYFSSLIWTAVRMGEAGIPMHRRKLAHIEQSCLKRIEKIDAYLACKYDLKLSGKGSPESKSKAITAAFEAIDDELNVHELLGFHSIYSHPAVSLTTVKRELSANQVNRALALGVLPDAHPLRKMLSLWNKREELNGYVSRYTYPLLRHRRNKQGKSLYDSVLLPGSEEAQTQGTEIAFPIWYVVPSNTKDDAGGGGGQRQGRIGCQKPAGSQFPPKIKGCRRSRYKNGVLIGGDVSQIELRVPAICSGDESLLRVYNEGGDLHRDRALATFGESVLQDPHFKSGDMRNDPRQWAKRFNFADLYWAGPKVMQQTLLLDAGRLFPLEFFRTIVATRPQIRPGLYAWQESLVEEAARVGYLLLPKTGHSRYFLAKEKAKPNEIVNFPVQTYAACTMIFIQRRIHETMPSLNYRDPPYVMYMNWYDATYLDCKQQYAAECIEVFNEAVRYVAEEGYWAELCEHYGHHVPLVCEVGAEGA